MLSNTAVPKYYGQFRDKVERGIIPVCENILLGMKNIERVIVNPYYYYDGAIVEGIIEFWDNEMVLTDGSPFHTLDEFKLWVEDLFGWYYFIERDVYVRDPETGQGTYVRRKVKKRLRKKQYLIVARGNAKSMYDAGLHYYVLNADTTTTHQIVVAPTMKQAQETVGPIQTAIARARGPLTAFLTEGSMQNTKATRKNRVKLASTKEGIVNYLTNSLIQVRPMRIDKLQGLRSKMNTIDEWLSCPIKEDVVGAIQQGASKLGNYIIVATSSEGTVRHAAGDDIKIELKKILKGDYETDAVSIWWYCLDSIDEVGDQSLWIKASPLIGQIVPYEEYIEDVERMEQVPTVRNEILAKRFGLPMEGYTFFFTHDETLPLPPRDYWRCPCSLGADLSCGDDFCAFTFMFPLRGGTEIGIKTHCYITRRTLDHVTASMAVKYREFMAEGSLIVMDSPALNMMEVYDDLQEYIAEQQYDIRTFGYDPYNAREFVERWIREYGDYGVDMVKQGARTESVPLGEIKSYSLDGALYFDQSIFSFTMGNCVVLEDTNGNRKLYKLRADRKIDAVSALIDAYVAYKHFPESF